MVFASLTFLYFFLPLNLILYYCSNNAYYRNFILTLFSFFFYAWGEPIWVFLLIFSATVDYWNGLFIEKHKGTFWAKLGVVSTLIFNLGILFFFKYSGFLYDNVNAIFGTSFQFPKYSLPIGISFYTFQTISYVIDVYRGEVKAQRSWLKFMMFVSLYHQLVAGPIVRYSHIMNEIDTRKFRIRDISGGITRFCVGLFKKVAIANIAAELVVKYLDNPELSSLSTGEMWFGVIMFSIQIYFDFSGYSDMAIGLGRMFGFHYHENFNYPYLAKTATDFWRRWHISLGTFFRDYVYIPMGGNKKNGYLNLLIVWGLTGLWHGANWNFIFWGLFFGILIMLERVITFKRINKVPGLFLRIYLLFSVVLGWAIFYFTDLLKLLICFKSLFHVADVAWWDYSLTLTLKENVYWLILAFLLCMPVYKYLVIKYRKVLLVKNSISLYWTGIAFSIVLLLISTALMVGKSYNPFIYYRF
jgi:alginate O-acetyltransferase complex protein AlgI